MTPTIRVLPLLLAVGCFRPDVSKIVYACDESNPCAVGTCIDNVCQASDGGSGGADLSASPDGASATGCADGGGKMLGAAWGCSGAFSAGQGRSLCAPGWKVCTAAAGIDLVECDKIVASFFVADVPGIKESAATYSCGQTVVYERLLFGCGGSPHAMGQISAMCGGFKLFVNCSPPAQYWDCSAGHSLTQTINKVAADGVLCCR